MKLDDSHPDYFVDDSAGQPENPVDGRLAADNGEKPGGKTISFADDDDTGGAHSDTSGTADKPSEHQKPHCRHRFRRFLLWFVLIALCVLGTAVYFRYFNPCVEDARMRCYIINVEKRGVVFKTFEADVVSEQSLTDTARVYSRDLSFSVDDPQLARKLQACQGTGRPVTIDYVTFSATVPWRGASKSVITGAQF